MSDAFCPMCRGTILVALERIATADLDHLYRRQLGIDVLTEFGDCTELLFYQCQECDLRFFWPMQPGGADFYGALHHRDWYYLPKKNEYDTGRRLLKNGDEVLDVGCGYGHFASHVQMVDGCRFTGLELTATAAQTAMEYGLDVRQEMIQRHAELRPGYYDVVCSFQVLEHVSEVKAFIEACRDCLKPGGLLIYSVPSADSFVSKVRNYTLNLPPHHLSWWTDKSLHNLARLFQLELIKIQPEPLDVEHFKTYGLSKATEALERVVGHRRTLIDRSPVHKMIRLIAMPMALCQFIGIKFSITRPRGHSVTAVYRKKVDC